MFHLGTKFLILSMHEVWHHRNSRFHLFSYSNQCIKVWEKYVYNFSNLVQVSLHMNYDSCGLIQKVLKEI